MFADTPNRPFYSYIITQSALVLIVLAASYLLTFLAFEHFGLHIDCILLSFGLILVTQLPVAAIYARTEGQEVDGNRGWTLAFVFVGVTLIGEAALQLASGHLLETWARFNGVAGAVQFDTLVTALCGVLAAVLLCVTVSKIIFRLAVTCHLRRLAKNAAGSIDVTDAHSPQNGVHAMQRPKVSQDFSEFFRRELVSANIAIFGLSLMMFGTDFMTILKLSIPASLVFSVICVANRLARSETRSSLMSRSLHISLQMLPLSVTCLILLALGELYSHYAATLATEASPVVFARVAANGLVQNTQVMWSVFAGLGMIFALSLVANALMLAVFTRLIRPIVCQVAPATITARPDAPRVSPENRLSQVPVAANTIGFVKGRDVVATLKHRRIATERPQLLLLQMDRATAA
ncbi:hypothetical protein [Neptunicoccus sediminis]|uniref:hypothetical protein n=1 Tax=Neptunicoccus sediminis TaxID=1892596 RepID=UPI000845DC7E|nr:hypothetical protein [Neptunicoccus sediminis]